MKGRVPRWIAFAFAFWFSAVGAAQSQTGSIRGVVYDKDFNVPLVAAKVTIVETKQTATTGDEGIFILNQVPPGKYTVVVSKEGYVRQVKADIVVSAGQLTDVDASLFGEFTDLDEFVVQDVLQVGSGTEAALLQLRLESASLMDSISSELIGRAAASDAAAALRLVSGASVQDGKYAVVRGLPDRYVSSQLNGVRLPTADENKRAVQLDLFPSAVIESIQVSKTFTPDQQGDASGGAVNVRLKSIPDEAVLQIKAQSSYNTQVSGRTDFVTYKGGGVNFFGIDDGDRDVQIANIGRSWRGAAGVNQGDSPTDYKWSIAGGGKHELTNGVKVGGFASLFYERNSAFFDNGIDDSRWVTQPGAPMTPQYYQGTPAKGDFKTGLFDVTQGRQSVRWGGLGTAGVESTNHSVGFTYLYTRVADDIATLAIDTRGKAYYFPVYNPNDPNDPASNLNNITAAPYIRLETLEYTERSTETAQLNGKHKFPFDDRSLGNALKFHCPELDWIVAGSSAELNQPDKRQFGALWHPRANNPGFSTPDIWFPYKPAANFTLGNIQHIFKDIQEDSDQYSLNVKLPFEQWSGDNGYVKSGVFNDHVTRRFNQDTFSNFNDNSAYQSGFGQPWSDVFPSQDHPITPASTDVDYNGDQKISAEYGMLDLPLAPFVKIIGGARFESTKIGIVNKPEPDAKWFPPGATGPIDLRPGDSDVSFKQDDVLPSIGVEVKPVEPVTLRASYNETIARQTFKELTPILQQEFLGGPIFIGNPALKMSALRNYDLRADYSLYDGGLVSASWFYKDIEDPIEYVQRFVNFTFTTPVNYPKGKLSGYELEVRQKIGHFWDRLEGLSVGANATFIDSEVTLPDDEARALEERTSIHLRKRDATNAPDHLYNFNVTYDLASTDTHVGLFYTVQGDTLIAGATQSLGNFVPSVYAKEYDTLNVSVAQKLGKNFTLQLQGKNLTNPKIETVYRASEIGSDVTRSSFTRGIEYVVSLTADFSF
ncbi:MAG: TonB-dependent receptor [Planctomycetes bacterium]|nr:TonB-dependent receptor [Planctomycetota bacterium]MBI3847894.1 TonB-dependent receptor [Planctomycetota bacterium]